MLDEIKKTFNNIKNAIIEKGVQIDDCDSPKTYANKILEIKQQGDQTFLFIPVFKSSSTKPAKPTGTMSISNPTAFPEGWGTPDGLQSPIWMSYTLIGKTTVYIPWTEPILISGDISSSDIKGSKAFPIYTDVSSLSLDISKPVGGTWDLTTNKLTGNISSSLSDGTSTLWSEDSKHVSGTYEYMSFGTFDGKNGSIIGEWSEPICINSAKDGKDGKDGTDGKDGINGEDGAAGLDGEPGKDGANGTPGVSIRTTVWEPEKKYYNGEDIDPDDNMIYLDIVSDKEMGTDEEVHYYTCIRTHTSSEEITYENGDFWEQIVGINRPIKTPLVLADKIKADLIDVDNLVADEAFINNLTTNEAFIENLEVKHLDGATGSFSGDLIVSNEHDLGYESVEISSTGDINVESVFNTTPELIQSYPEYNESQYVEKIKIDPSASPYSIEDPLIKINTTVPNKPAVRLQNGFICYPIKLLRSSVSNYQITNDFIILCVFSAVGNGSTIYLPKARHYQIGRHITIWRLHKEYSVWPKICAFNDEDDERFWYVDMINGNTLSTKELVWPSSSYIKADCYCVDDDGTPYWYVVFS